MTQFNMLKESVGSLMLLTCHYAHKEADVERA